MRQQTAELIREVLKKNPQGLSITDIVRQIHVNRNTAGRYLEKLLVSGQVEMRHLGMAKIYALSNRVPVSAVLSISSELILQLDNSTRIVFINDAFARLLSVPANELAGKNIEYTPLVSAFDDLFPAFMERVKAGLEGTEWRGELGLVRGGISFSCRIAPTALDHGQKGVSIILEDITAAKRAGDSLRESEERYRQLAESSNDLIFVIGMNDRVKYVNSYAAAFLGTTPAEVTGKARSLLFPQETARRQEMLIQQVFSTGKSAHSKSPLALNDGMRWFDHVLVPLKSPDGSVHSVLGISRDITERKQAEETIKNSEERYRRLLQRSFDAVVIHKNGIITLVNQAAVTLAGVATAADLVGKSIENFVHSEYRDMVRERIGAMTETGEPIAVGVAEEKFVRPDGKVVDVEVIATSFPDNGEPAIQVVFRDITRRRELMEALLRSEEKYRTLVEHSQSGVFIIHGRKILYVNAAFARILGGVPEDFIGGDFGACIAPEDRDRVLEIGHRRQSGEQVPETYECILLKQDKTTRVMVALDAGLILYQRAIASMGTIRDITEQKRTEAALIESGEKLRAVFDSTFQFTGMMMPDGTLIDINRTALDFTGAKREEVLNRPFWETRWWQGDATRVQRLREAVAEAAAGTFVRYETPVQGTGSTTMETDFSLKPVFDAAGRVWLLIAEGRDITARRRAEDLLRESEDRFRRVFEDGPLGMVIVDSNHRFVSVNRMCCEIFGYTEEDMLGKTIEDVTHPDHLDQDTRGMQDLYAGKIARYHTEKQYIRKDGSVIWGSLTVSPLRDRTGKIVSTIGLVEEIADWKEKGTEDTQ